MSLNLFPPQPTRRLGSLAVYAALGVLPLSESMSEAQRMCAERPDLARKVAAGEEVTWTSLRGEQLTFSQRKGPWHG